MIEGRNKSGRGRYTRRQIMDGVNIQLNVQLKRTAQDSDSFFKTLQLTAI